MTTSAVGPAGIEDICVLAGIEKSRVEQHLSGFDTRKALIATAGVVAATAAVAFAVETARMVREHDLDRD